MSDLFDTLDSLNHVEETFYQTGYQEGFDHGALHGIFEGRALGKEKGFELWEEVGFYEGVGEFWKEILGETKSTSRAIVNINQLLHLISLFPTHNMAPPEPSTSSAPSPTTPPPSSTEPTSSTAASPETDIAALLERIRAKYKLVCSSLGVRPRLVEAKTPLNVDGDELIGGLELANEGSSALPNGTTKGNRKGTVVVNGVEVSSKALLF